MIHHDKVGFFLEMQGWFTIQNQYNSPYQQIEKNIIISTDF